MYGIAAERLRETLNWWKTLNYYREVVMPITHPHLVGPVTRTHLSRWRSYERMVLNNSITQLDLREWFPLPSQRETFHGRMLETLTFFPIELFEWNRKSRRTIHIPRELQYLLIRGDYKRIRWEDILWPYEAFVLTLEEPIRLEEDPGMWSSFDTLLVSHIPIEDKGKILRVRLLRRSNGTLLGNFPEQERRLAERFLRNNQFERVQGVMRRGLRKVVDDMGTAQGFRSAELYSTIPGSQYIALPGDRVLIEPDDLVNYISSVIGPTLPRAEALWRSEYMSLTLKLVVGWSLYMESISSESLQTMRLPPGGSRGITGIITSPEYICTIIGKGRLDPTRYVDVDLGKVSSTAFKRPHWRRGHWKREAGTSKNAPKTIRVPPVLVRKDLVPLFGIISGTETIMLPDE
ncbi:hypothetical protein HY413_03915 [Candidatus Kaiserbacteria bacterium]|nr:hypothetical protein [Candidatus Kaiserbacteria bacterium]